MTPNDQLPVPYDHDTIWPFIVHSQPRRSSSEGRILHPFRPAWLSCKHPVWQQPSPCSPICTTRFTSARLPRNFAIRQFSARTTGLPFSSTVYYFSVGNSIFRDRMAVRFQNRWCNCPVSLSIKSFWTDWDLGGTWVFGPFGLSISLEVVDAVLNDYKDAGL